MIALAAAAAAVAVCVGFIVFARLTAARDLRESEERLRQARRALDIAQAEKDLAYALSSRNLTRIAAARARLRRLHTPRR